MKCAFVVLFASVSFAAVGCSSEHDHGADAGAHTSAFASCQAIIDACHEVDVGEGPASACHDVAHDEGATEEKCAAKKAECTVTCKAAAVPTDGGAEAQASDAAHEHDH